MDVKFYLPPITLIADHAEIIVLFYPTWQLLLLALEASALATLVLLGSLTASSTMEDVP